MPSMSDVENDISRLNFLGGGEVCRARTFRSVPTDVAAAADDDDDNLAPSTSREERETESRRYFVLFEFFSTPIRFAFVISPIA